MCVLEYEVVFFPHFHNINNDNKCEINWYICGLIGMHILNKIVYTCFCTRIPSAACYAVSVVHFDDGGEW